MSPPRPIRFDSTAANHRRIIINPNRLYPIELAIRSTRRFSINIFANSQRAEALRLMNIRRREPDKSGVLGWSLEENELDIPYLQDCQQTVFCEIENALNTGDHAVMIW